MRRGDLDLAPFRAPLPTTTFPPITSFSRYVMNPDNTEAPANCAIAQLVYGLEKAGLSFAETVAVWRLRPRVSVPPRQPRTWGKVIVIDGTPERLELAIALGANEFIDARPLKNLADQVHREGHLIRHSPVPTHWRRPTGPLRSMISGWLTRLPSSAKPR